MCSCGPWRCLCRTKRRVGAGLLRRPRPRRLAGLLSVARWRERPGPADVPAWVWDNVNDPAVGVWLDELWRQDRDRWDRAIIEILSTPTYANGSRWSPDG